MLNLKWIIYEPKNSTDIWIIIFNLVFDSSEENKFSYTDIHQDYGKLVSILLFCLQIAVVIL